MKFIRTMLDEARDPNTPTKRLREIMAPKMTPEVAQAVAAHPNTRLDMLLSLVPHHHQAVVQNPALPHLLLEKDRGQIQLRLKTAGALLRYEDVPATLLHPLTGLPGLLGQEARLHVGLAGAAEADWEAEAREALWEAAGLVESSDLSFTARAEAAPTPLLLLDQAPDWLLEPLAAHADAAVRRTIARSPRTARSLLTPLRRAGSTSDLGGPAPPDPGLPAPVLARLARGGPWARRLAARHPNTPPNVLESLFGLHADDVTLCWYLVRNPATPPQARAALVASAGPEFRRAIARDPETTPESLANLAVDVVRDVRWMAARNPNTPAESLVSLAQDADARVRQGVGRNVAAPPFLLAQLACDPGRWVRLAAARHPHTPPAALAKLAGDTDEEVRQAVWRRTQPSAQKINRARDWDGTSEMRQRLADDFDQKISSSPRKAHAHPGEVAEALDQAAAHGGLLAKAAALAHPDVAPKFLASGAVEGVWVLRFAVARNPAVLLHALALPGPDSDLLATLARDSNRLVRAAARVALLPLQSEEADR